MRPFFQPRHVPQRGERLERNYRTPCKACNVHDALKCFWAYTDNTVPNARFRHPIDRLIFRLPEEAGML